MPSFIPNFYLFDLLLLANIPILLSEKFFLTHCENNSQIHTFISNCVNEQIFATNINC